MEAISHKDLTSILAHCAQLGRVNLEALETEADIATAAKFSSHFREAVKGLETAAVWKAITAVKAKGPRKFYSGCGRWLTAKEWNNGK